jgi:hypothetical protein
MLVRFCLLSYNDDHLKGFLPAGSRGGNDDNSLIIR